MKTPIRAPLSCRVLPPPVAYAAGLLCCHQPDIADEVRAAVLGEDPVYDLDALSLACAAKRDTIGALACDHLREIVHTNGGAPAALHTLADALDLIPGSGPSMPIVSRGGSERIGKPTLCDVVLFFGYGHVVVGLGDDMWRPDWHQGADLLNAYLREGWGPAWGQGTLPGEREALRRLTPIHAHTVSLDAEVRAAWAKAHLDAIQALEVR